MPINRWSLYEEQAVEWIDTAGAAAVLPATTNPDPKYCDPGTPNALYRNAS